MADTIKGTDFGRVFLPHMDAAYNLARWIVRDDSDAQDVVQEAYLRAVRFVDGYRGGDGRAWILAIVRRTAFSWIARNRRDPPVEFQEDLHSGPAAEIGLEAETLRKADAAMLRAALAELAPEFREAIVLRDLEGFSYKEIAEIADLPIGTVMSRLARGRDRLARLVKARMVKEA